jgi:hypothetical protein
LRKVASINDSSKKKERQIKLEDFGLNISQIKRLEMPLKSNAIKERLSSNKPYRTFDHANNQSG